MFVVHSTLYFWIFIIVFAAVIALYGFKGWFKLTSDNLYGQPLFWLSILGPLFSCFYFGAPVWSQSSFLISAAGYQHFYDISKIPLLLLASAVPFTAIIVSLHRTVQVEKQIATAEFKNKMDEFYSHNKHMVEAFSKITTHKLRFTKAKLHCLQEDKIFQITRPHSLYKRIFPTCSPLLGVNYAPDQKFRTGALTRFKRLDTSLLALTEVVLDAIGNNQVTSNEKKLLDDIKNALFSISVWFEFQGRPADINLIHFKPNTKRHPDLVSIVYEIRATYLLFNKICTDVMDTVGIDAISDKEMMQTLSSIFRHGKNIQNYVVKGTAIP